MLLARLFVEGRSPSDAFWSGELISSRLLEYEVFNRVHARGAGPSHGSDARNQDIVAWISQGAIADRTRETLGASDRGVVMLRRRLLDDLAAIAERKEPRGLIRDPAKNVRIELPCVGREEQMNGLPREKMLKHPVMGPFLREFYSMAGQPKEIREEFEQAMSVKQTSLELHKLIPQ